jgi:glyoxylase-like metal-dependent hydrolase (beta-lactamase superfamily II)
MIALEDSHEDIIAKAMQGQKIGRSELSILTGLEKSDIEHLINGNFSKESIIKIAPHLWLDTKKLLNSAQKRWCPKKKVIPGLNKFKSNFRSMTVNAYIIFDQTSKRAWLFDTGTECGSLLSFLEHETLTLDSIFLTHTHRDHVFCLDEIKEHTGNPKVYTHSSEPIKDSILIEEGFSISTGRLSLKAFHTHGHSVGGITYVIDGLELPVAIVGDALFAGSMGGGMVSYQDALRTNREKIMTLPDETILCPGHGPMTTVGEEKKYNPFFPEF